MTPTTTIPRSLLLRVGSFLAATASVVSLSAQNPVTTTTVDPEKKDETVLLSKFNVASTQDKGYTSTNAATGFKTNDDLMSIPQAVTVVTRDLINDVGAV